jgi:hypothetical protein
MEEILASIRRIISDENNSAVAQPAPQAAPAQAAPKAAAPAPAARKPEPVVEEEPDVLELTDVVEEKPRESFRRSEPAADVMFRDPEPPVREPAPRFNPPAAPGRMDEQLLSQHTSSAVSSAFGALMNSTGDSRTVDDLVREMLRPMLKTWLDDNLPNLVERLVRAEIERVSRGQ